jgi:3',5'-cyclic AMP phosphodiesterase CpdA
MSSQNDRDRFNWLHFGNWPGPTSTKDRAARSHWKALGEDLASLQDEAGPWDAVFLSGDITRTGTPSEYELVTEQLGDLVDKLCRLGSHPVVLAVPGNGDRPKTETGPYPFSSDSSTRNR